MITKTFISFLLITLFSLPALACMESAEAKEKRFVTMDANHDNVISYEEFIAGKNYNEAQKQAAKEHHFKDKDTMNKEQFMKISFVKGCH